MNFIHEMRGRKGRQKFMFISVIFLSCVQKCASQTYTGECAGGGGLALTHSMYKKGYAAYKDIACIPAYLFCDYPTGNNCAVGRSFSGEVTIEGKLESLRHIEDNAFYYFGGKVTFTADCPNLKEVGDNAFRMAKNRASKVVLSNAPKLDTVR